MAEESVIGDTHESGNTMTCRLWSWSGWATRAIETLAALEIPEAERDSYAEKIMAQ